MNFVSRWSLPRRAVVFSMWEMLRGSLWLALWCSWGLSGLLFFGGSNTVRASLLAGSVVGISAGCRFTVSACCSLPMLWRQRVWLLAYLLSALSSVGVLKLWNQLSEVLFRLAPDSAYWPPVVLFVTTVLIYLVPACFASLAGLLVMAWMNSKEPAPESQVQVEGIGWPLFCTLGGGLFVVFGFPEFIRTFGATWMNVGGVLVASIMIGVSFWRPNMLENHSAARRTLEISWSGLISCLAAVMLWMVAGRMIAQLFPETTEILIGTFGLTFVGFAIGHAWATIGSPRLSWVTLSSSHQQFAWFLLALMGLSAFPWGIGYSIWVNAGFVSSWNVYMARLLLLGLVYLPLGGLVGSSIVPMRQPVLAPFPNHLPIELALFCCTALGAVSFVVLIQWGVPPLLGVSMVLMLISFCGNLWSRSSHIQWRISGIVAIGCMSLVATTLWNYDPVAATRWISSSRGINPNAVGGGRELIPHLSDIHLVDHRLGANGVLTLWQSRGSYLNLRENGVPRSTMTGDLRVHPDYSAELLAGALPVVLHESAERILLMGLGGASALEPILDGPVQEVDVIESNPAVVDILQQKLENSRGFNWSNERLSLMKRDPISWLAATTSKYDVVISNPDPIVFPGSAAAFTSEYYQKVVKRLEPTGIFCQRFLAIDFGIEPLLSVTSTMRRHFRDVIVIEAAESDFLLIGSNDSQGTVRPNLVERIQAPQVSRAISRLGWDSLLALTMPAINCRTLEELTPVGIAPINGLDGQVAIRWPREISRGANKSAELHQYLAGKSQKLLDWVPGEGQSRAVLRRLGEIQAQGDLIVKYPDQYWAYRKNAKEEVSKNPKTLISQIDFQVNKGRLDPEDRRRMSYFGLLGVASKSLKVEDIQKLERFMSPFDPLISPFVSQEIAELYGRAGHPDPVNELKHRLHTIYYAGPGDRSVLYLSGALDLIQAHPEAIGNPRDRWMCCDSLLQMLKLRWDLRMSGPLGLPRIAYRDANLSLGAIEVTLASMREQAPAAGISPEECRRRLLVLQRTLVQPLQNYRQKLSPYLTPSELANKGDRLPQGPENQSGKGQPEPAIEVQAN